METKKPMPRLADPLYSLSGLGTHPFDISRYERIFAARPPAVIAGEFRGLPVYHDLECRQPVSTVLFRTRGRAADRPFDERANEKE
jgi:hypothetical protein